MRLWIGFTLLCATAALGWGQRYTISMFAGGMLPPTPSTATNVSLGIVAGIGVDSAGNAYFSTYLHCVFKLDRNGILTRVAGTGTPGYSGDGGPATSAQLHDPQGLAIDAGGNLYITDTFNGRIRKVTPSGIITTIAGTGDSGSLGDGGPATSALLYSPQDVAIDTAGDLYIADGYHCRVRKVSQSGMITTVAGSGTSGYTGDGGPATSARISFPNGVAVDAGGNLYIADSSNYRVRKVSPGGIITTIAGNGTIGDSGDGGPAVSAQLSVPSDLAVDAAGNVYIADGTNARVRKVAPGGLITTVAGNGTQAYSGDGGPAASAQLRYSLRVAFDSEGNLFIADIFNHRIRKVEPSGVINTIAGNGNYPEYGGEGGPVTNAQLGNAYGLVIDAAGNRYISNSSRVLKATPGGIIMTIAGNGTMGYSGDGGPATSAQLQAAASLAVDTSGALYIADLGNSRVRKVTPGGQITTVAGNGTQGYSGDGGPAMNAQLVRPSGLAVDAAGNLYIADSLDHRIRKVTPGGIITTVVGDGNADFSGDGGAAVSARVSSPNGLAFDTSGNLYIADTGNHRIRKVTPAGIITTVAGNGLPGYAGDGGLATSAQLYSPNGVTTDAAGNIYVTDRGNNRLRKITPSGLINTVAGNGAEGYGGDGGPATSAQLSAPASVAVDAAGRVYVTTKSGGPVRLLTPDLMGTDFNADGSADVLWQNDTTRQVSVWYLGGTQGNTRLNDAWLAANGPQGWRVVGTADFNSDGKPDLVWQNDTTRQVSVWYLGGAQGSTLLGDAWLAPNSVPGWRVVAAKDLNGDGKPDLVWQNDTTRQVSVWYLGGAEGNTFLSDAWLASTGPQGWRVVGVADFNGDGKLDLVWQHETTRQVAVWYLGGAQGNTFLSDAWLAANGPQGWRIAGITDLNGDGKPDLLWQQDSTRQVVVWYLGGTQGNTFLSDAWLAQNGPQGWTLLSR